MITILRNNQRILMLVIAVLTIIAFAFLYNPISTKGLAPDSVVTIYGKSYARADIDREANNYRLAIQMGQFEMARDLAAMANSQEAMATEFILNHIVLQHEAKELGIEATQEQVKKAIMSAPAFQTNGQFDPRKYGKLVETELGPHGFTEEQIEKVMRASLNLERVKAVVTAPIAVSDSEVNEACRMFQKLDVQQVKFPLLDVEMSVQVTDEEARGAYERNMNSLVAPETRTVEYVEFALPAAQAALQGKEKIEAQQKLADAASAFAEKASANFEQAAQAANLPIKKTPDFDQSGFTKDAGTTPDAAQVAADIKGFARAAFMLGTENPVSDVVQAGDKFVVLKLAGSMPQRTLTFDEAKDQLVARLRAIKAQRLVQDNAAAALSRIRELMKAGKSFADAAGELGLKVETISGLDPAGDQLGAGHAELAQATLFMNPGQVSNFIPTSDGGFAVFLAARAPLSAEDLAKHRQEIEPDILASKQQILFITWLSSAREAAKISFPAHQSGS